VSGHPGAAGEHSPHERPHEHGDIRFTPEFWDERYASADQIWSGRVNPQLVTVAGDLDPGTALDVGSGEGADAVWLADHGWEVTAVDISVVALERAAAHARLTAPDAAQRVTWRQTDVLTWEPPTATFDLVSAQFMHLPGPELADLHRRLAASVRPGGTLLVVGHHPSDLHTSMGRPDRADLLFTAEAVGQRLDSDAWEVLRADAPSREAVDPDGRTVTIRDAVLVARRRHRPRP
jgi:SAM-dependent methyltransferase